MPLNLRIRLTNADVDNVALVRGYQATVPDPASGGMIPNPQTKDQFVEADMHAYYDAITTQVEVSAAADAARAAKETEIRARPKRVTT